MDKVTAIASYTDLTDVAAFLAAGLTEANGESYVAIINDAGGDNAFAYLIANVAGGSIDAAEVSLIGSIPSIGTTIFDKNDIIAA